ncbi:hypothetical protein EJ04DRAFT_517227 [Polyplosphaeria fusca]|uniref:Uncharacterized protein n=1 Tax=Polyplosphaeria fusca TaxID=682080 RepID=A0A9P4UT66_9PLEO|nr:hypothetical protein EJ04DRAFT_517227 [Polyplosphaeria fusca]
MTRIRTDLITASSAPQVGVKSGLTSSFFFSCSSQPQSCTWASSLSPDNSCRCGDC